MGDSGANKHRTCCVHSERHRSIHEHLRRYCRIAWDTGPQAHAVYRLTQEHYTAADHFIQARSLCDSTAPFPLSSFYVHICTVIPLLDFIVRRCAVKYRLVDLDALTNTACSFWRSHQARVHKSTHRALLISYWAVFCCAFSHLSLPFHFRLVLVRLPFPFLLISLFALFSFPYFIANSRAVPSWKASGVRLVRRSPPAVVIHTRTGLCFTAYPRL